MSKIFENISTSSEDLEKWNEYYAERFFTSTVFVSVLLSIGIPGNLLVVIVYHFRLRKVGSGRYFIKYLAACDITGLIISGTLNLLRNLHHVTFPGNVTCKILLFLSYSITCASLTILVIIAIQRFFIICFHPPKEMSHALRRCALAFSAIFSLSASSPILIFYGGLQIENRTLNVTGFTCALLHTIDMRRFYNYQYASVVLNTLGLALLIASYAAIGVKVIHRRRSVRVYNIQNRVEEGRNDDTNNRLSRLENASKGNNSKVANGKRQGTKRKKMAKLSKMFRTISIIAFLSYVPIWVFIFIESNNFWFWDELSSVLLQICLILRTSYLLIHTTNPFIYAYLDCQFRRELMSLFRIRWKSKDDDSNDINSS